MSLVKSAIVVGGGFLAAYTTFALVYFLSRKALPGPAGSVNNLTPLPYPVPTPNGGAVPPYHPTKPALMHGLALRPGLRYHAQIEVNFPASLAASVSKVKEMAEGLGFSRVEVFEKKPADFPEPDHGADYYVRAVYTSIPQTLQKSHGGGQVNVLAAWEG
jgi:hypothetical protein